MKIENKTITFDDLAQGGIFRYESELYIRGEADIVGVLCTNLVTGEYKRIDRARDVIPVRAKLVIE